MQENKNIFVSREARFIIIYYMISFIHLIMCSFVCFLVSSFLCFSMFYYSCIMLLIFHSGSHSPLFFWGDTSFNVIVYYNYLTCAYFYLFIHCIICLKYLILFKHNLIIHSFILHVLLYYSSIMLLKCPYYGLWKVHISVLGVPNNRLTCMQCQKTLS